MNRLERVSKIRELIKLAGGSLQTRKKLHKLIYLLQELGEDFDQDYYYYNYGVFSQSLAQDLDFAKENNEIIEKQDVNNAYAFTVGKANYLIEDESISEKSVERISILSKKSPKLLEAFSTIVYLNRNHYSGEELENKLSELKPDHKDEFKEAYSLANKYFGIEV